MARAIIARRIAVIFVVPINCRPFLLKFFNYFSGVLRTDVNRFFD
jgi:hypothetical protein